MYLVQEPESQRANGVDKSKSEGLRTGSAEGKSRLMSGSHSQAE